MLNIIERDEGFFSFYGIGFYHYNNITRTTCEICGDRLLDVEYSFILKQLNESNLLPENFMKACCICNMLISGNAFQIKVHSNILLYNIFDKNHVATVILNLKRLKKRNEKAYDFVIKILREKYGVVVDE